MRELSLECRDGEFLVLLGPTGSGKSTILKLVAGLERPDAGIVAIDGCDVRHLSPRERNVAMVFETYALYPNLTVYENIASPLRAQRLDADTVRRSVTEVAQLLGIGDLLSRRPHELSGGQRQRVALGRALVRKPRVFLLDEPIAHLDAKLRHRMRSELRKLAEQLKVTTIYATNDYREALAMGDRVAVLKEGQLLQVDPPEKVFHSPAHQLVADMVGDPGMNFLDASVEGARTLHFDGFSISLDWGTLASLPERVRVGIRPADVGLSLRSQDGAIPAEVYVVEPVGAVTIVTLRLPGGELIKAKTRERVEAGPGDRAWVRLPLSSLHFFCPRTGQRFVI